MTATATYRDPWAGAVPVWLVPQAQRGKIVYRWRTDDGCTCDGLRRGFGREAMIAHATRHPAFSEVVSGDSRDPKREG